jgi:hypothetical protein
METLFYVGQTVVALKDHSQGDYQKGDEVEVLSIKRMCCYVGIIISNGNHEGSVTYCRDCNSYHSTPDGIYYDQKNFAPLQHISNMTYEDAIELVSVKELII